LSYCPHSSLPAAVLAWLVQRLADLAPPRPPGQGGNRPLVLPFQGAPFDSVGGRFVTFVDPFGNQYLLHETTG
jgi:hypothetical protein